MTRRRTRLLLLTIAGLVLTVGFGMLLGDSGPTASAGPVCTKSWAAPVDGLWDVGANWTPTGAPAATDDVCVTVAGTYTVTQHQSVSVHSLQVGGTTGGGTASLEIEGKGCSYNSDLTVSTTTDLSARGRLALTSGGCGGANAGFQGIGPVTNNGTIAAVAGTGGTRTIQGSIDNTGSITVNQATTYSGGGTLTNDGTISVAEPLSVAASTLRNDGTVDGTGAGAVNIVNNSTFDQGIGATTGNPVVVENATLKFSGPGSPGGSFTLHANVTLQGDVPSGSTVTIEGKGCSFNTSVTAGYWTNNGTIALTSGGCGGASAELTGTGTLTNNGTITVEPGSGGNRYLRTDVENRGTIAVAQPLSYDGAGTTFDNYGIVSLTEPFNATGAAVKNWSGSINSAGPGVFNVENSSTFDQGDGATTGNPVVVVDSTLRFSGSGPTSASFTLHHNVTLQGDVPSGVTVTIEGKGCSYSTKVTATDAYFDNAGTIHLTAGGCGGASAELTGTGRLTNTGLITIDEGTGGNRYLRIPVENNGTIRVDQPLDYDVAGTTFDNRGTVSLTQPFTATGAYVINRSGSIDGTGSGVFNVVNSSTIEQFDGITTGNPVVVENSTLSFTGPSSGSFTLHAAVTLASGVPSGVTLTIEGKGCSFDTTVTTSGYLTNDGTIILISGGCGGSSATLSVSGALINTGTITPLPGNGGSRTITATSLDNSGSLILPSGAPLTLNGDFVQNASGTLQVDVVGPGDNGRIDISGTASFDGALRTDTTFTPATGSIFQVATYASATGTFASVPTTGTQYTVDVGPTGLTLIVLDPSSTALTSTPAGPTVTGQAVTFTAVVSATPPATGTPTGDVEFRTEPGGTVLATRPLDGSGQATFTTTTLPLGSSDVVAEYLGDVTFAHSTSSVVTRQVDAGSTATVWAGTPNPASVGEVVTFDATVTPVAPSTGNPTGTVTFREGSTIIGSAPLNPSGHATLDVATLPVGSHSVVADYAGDSAFNGSTSPSAPQVILPPTTPPGPGCTKSWAAPVGGLWHEDASWTPIGIPTASDDVCITVAGTYTVALLQSATVHSLQIGGTSGAGTASLEVEGVGCSYDSDLTVATTTDISARGRLALTSSGCGAAAAEFQGTGLLTNDGTIDAAAGTGGTRTIQAPVRNNATITINQATTYSGSNTLVNRGTVSVSQPLSVSSATLWNSGTIDVSGAGAVNVINNSTFNQGEGFTTGNAVVVENSTLRFTGLEAVSGSFTLHRAVTLDGNVPWTVTVTIEGVGCDYDTSVTTSGTFTNDGTIHLTSGGGCGGAAATLTGPGTLNNTGTLTVDTGAGGERYLRTNVHNEGTINIDQPLTYDGAGKTFENRSTVSLTQPFTATGATVINRSGSIGATGAGVLHVAGTAMLEQIDGIVAGNAAVVENSTLKFSGSGSGSFTLHDTVTLNGSIPSGATMTIEGVGCSYDTSVTATAGFTNDGTIHLTSVGACGGAAASLSVPGTLDNSGTIRPLAGTGGSRTITATVLNNSGTVALASGAPLTLNGDFVQDPSGTLQVGVDGPGTNGRIDISGSASIDGALVTDTTFTPAPAATFQVATYASATGTFASTSTTGTQYAVDVGPTELSLLILDPSSTALSSTSAGPTVTGQAVTFTAIVTATPPASGTPTGDVEFRTDPGGTVLATKPLDGAGQASFTTTDLPGGSTDVVAEYLGDVTFARSTSAPVTRQVDPGSTVTVLASTPNPASPGEVVTFDASVTAVAPSTGNPTGTVTFTEGSTVIGSAPLDSSGHATLDVATLPIGSHSVIAGYAGDSAFNGSTSSSTTQVVLPPTTTTTTTTTTLPPPTTTTTTTTPPPTTTTTTPPSTTTTPPSTTTTLPPPPTTTTTTTTTTPPTTTTTPPTTTTTTTTLPPPPTTTTTTTTTTPPPPPTTTTTTTTTTPPTTTTTPPTTTTTTTTLPPTTTTSPPATTLPPLPPPTIPGSGSGPSAGGGATPLPGSGSPSGVAGRSPPNTAPDLVGHNDDVIADPALPMADDAPDAEAGAGRSPTSSGSGASSKSKKAAGQGDNGDPQPAAAGSERSTLVTSTASLHEISTDPGFILSNLLLSAMLVMLILFPAHMFNSTLAENYDEVLGWFSPIERQLDKFRARRGTLPTWFVLGGMAVAGALLFGFLDPNFGFNTESLALVLGLLASLVIVSCVYDVARAVYLRRRLGIHSHVRSYPAGIFVAAALVGVSRLVHFTPGYLFGVFTALGFSLQPKEEDQGRGIAVASVWLLATAVLCWLAWTPVNTAAMKPEPTFTMLLLDAALCTTWIAGIQGLIFGLLPLRFLDGQKVLHWNKIAWAVLVFFGVFAFVHTMARPGRAAPGHETFWPLMALFGGFTLASVLFWAYFRLRKPRRPTEPPAPPETPGGGELVDA